MDFRADMMDTANRSDKKIWIELFFTFVKIGLFTFGGGYAMISLIENICVEKKKWITHDEMMNVTVIAESTPGPVAINCATFVGYKRGKLPGAVCATLGVVLPSFLIIYFISRFMDGFLEIPWVNNAFQGIKIAVGILIVDAAVKLFKKMAMTGVQICIVICSVIAMLVTDLFALKISSVSLMLLAAFVGVIVFVLKEHAGKGKAEK